MALPIAKGKSKKTKKPGSYSPSVVAKAGAMSSASNDSFSPGNIFKMMIERSLDRKIINGK